MPISSAQLAASGLAAIDHYAKNTPKDQVNATRPLTKHLVRRRQSYPGGQEYHVITLHSSNDSNFQAYSGSSNVTYNNRRTLEHAKFRYASFHEGFGLDEDELTRNGIVYHEHGRPRMSAAEEVQITNLLEENTRSMHQGFETGLDRVLHRNGAQNVEEIPGLDHLVSLTPNTGTVAGISAASNSYWRNYAALDLTANNLITTMESGWKACVQYSGQAPDIILMGSGFQKIYRNATNAEVTRTVQVAPAGGSVSKLDPAIGGKLDTGLFYNNVAMEWDPTFEILDTLDSPTQKWTNRCYFLNLNDLRLKPIDGHWKVPRMPRRPHNQYVHYWAITAKCSLTLSQRNAHAVFTVTGA